MNVNNAYAYVNFGMTGTIPLRMADLVFTRDCLVIAVYGRITPLFGLARGTPKRSAAAMRRRYEEDGIDGVLVAADEVHRIEYDDVDRIELYDGGRIAREKIAVHTGDEPPYAYRIHAPIDIPALADALSPVLGESVEIQTGMGFNPRMSIARFSVGR
ncbi:hypothetical protein [Haladaptatus sp. DFWS20]|uniref:hypothetical protein n=1 Tax=Haladaptatus sp. DFWS20 TaxID=3403467 RepID=UPI003EC14D17